MAKQLNVNLAFTADTGKAKAQLQDLQTSLNQLMINAGKTSSTGLGLNQDLTQAIGKVAELSSMLEMAKTSAGGLDLGKLNLSMKQNNTSVADYARSLSALGTQGEQAFAKLAQSITTAEVPLRRSNTLLSQFATTLKNTARWQISSSILHSFMGTVQSAYGYAQDLNESLNNIRIVTGQNAEQMAKFAEQANKAAKALSTTTTEYTNASLIYYQQGLNDQEVQDRTDITIKMAHAAGESAEIVSDQLTAVWNNFYDGSKSLEHYADVMTALGAATASSTDEIAGGLEKFASIADMIGLSYEYAASALATITATTRQSEDVVGTALKTIFARIQGLNLGETLDDGTTLNKYSEALDKIGISIYEQNGELKDMDSILNEMGAKWKALNKDQQVALAQTVAGVRQYNQLVSLMDNWDFFESNLNIANTSDGALQEQADIYAESWEAARDRVAAAAQDIYDSILDDKFFIALTNGFGKFLGVLGDTVDTLGGLPGILSVASVLLFKMFGADMAASIDRWGYNIKIRSKEGLNEIIKLRQQANTELRSMFIDNANDGVVNQTKGDVYTQQANLQDTLLAKQQQLVATGRNLTEEEQKQAGLLLDINNQLGQSAIKAAENLESQIRTSEELESQYQVQLRAAQKSGTLGQGDVSNFKNQLKGIKELQVQYGLLSNVSSKLNRNKDFNASVESLQDLSKTAKNAGIDFSSLDAILKDVSKGNIKDMETLRNAVQDAMYDIGASAQINFDKLRDSAERAGLNMQELNPILDKMQQSFAATGRLTAEEIQILKDYGLSVDAAIEKIKLMGHQAPTAAQGLMTLGSTLSSIAMTITSIKGLFDAWNNEDMTFGEKLISTFTTLGMVIPMVTMAFKKQNMESLASLSASILQVAGLGGVAAAETLTKIATDGLTASTISFGTALWTVLWPIGLVIAAVTLLVSGITALVKAYNADADASKKAQEELKTANQALDDAKQKYEEVAEAIKTYEESVDTLSKIRQGTEEWDNAVKDLNVDILELIKSYSGLAQYVTNKDGVLTISQEGLDWLEETQVSNVRTAEINSYNAQVRANKAENRSETTDLSREITAWVSAGDSTYDAFDRNTTEQVLNAIAKNGNTIFADTKDSSAQDSLANALYGAGFDELTHAQQAVVDASIENSDKLMQLAIDIEANSQANRILTEQIANSALADNSKYNAAGNDAQNAVDQIIANALENVNDSTWSQTYIGADGITMDDKSVQAEYAKLMGWDTTNIGNKSGYGEYNLADGTTYKIDDTTARYALNQQKKLEELTGAGSTSDKAIQDFAELSADALDVDNMKEYLEYREDYYKIAQDTYNLTDEQVEKLLQESGAVGELAKSYDIASEMAVKFNGEENPDDKYYEEMAKAMEDLSDEELTIALDVLADSTTLEEFQTKFEQACTEAMINSWNVSAETMKTVMDEGSKEGKFSDENMAALESDDGFIESLKEQGISFKEFQLQTFDEQYAMVLRYYQDVSAASAEAYETQKGYLMQEKLDKETQLNALRSAQKEYNQLILDGKDEQAKELAKEFEDTWDIEITADITEAETELDLINDKLKDLEDKHIEIAIDWDGIDEIENGIKQTAEFTKLLKDETKKVGNSYQMTAAQAKDWMQVYPELFENATVTTDGLISLDESYVNEFINGKEAMSKASIEQKLLDLEAEEARLLAEKDSLQAEFDAVKAVKEGEMKAEQLSAEQLSDLHSRLTQYYIDLGYDEAEAHAQALNDMGLDEETYSKLVANAAETNAKNQAKAAKEGADAQAEALSGLANLWQKFVDGLKRASQAVKRALTGEEVDQTFGEISPSVSVDDGSFSGYSMTETFAGTDKSGILDAFDKGSFNSALDGITLDMSEIDAALASIKNQKTYLEALKNQELDDFGITDPDKVNDTGKALADLAERYHEITREITAQEHALDKLNKEKDKAFGSDKLKFIDEEIKGYQNLYEEQNKLYLLRLADLALDQQNLQKTFNGKVDFNKDTHEINNFTDLYNSATEEQRKLLEEYEKSLDALRDQEDTLYDIASTLQSLNLEKITVEVESEVEINQRDLDKLDYIIDKLGRNLNTAIEQIDALGQQIGKYDSQSKSYRQGIADIKANAAAQGRALTDDEQRKIQEYEDALLDINGALLDIVETVEAKLLEEFDEFNSKIDENISRFDTYNSVLDHYSNIIKLSGRQTKDSMLLMELSAQKTDIALQKLNASRDKYLANQSVQSDVKDQLDVAIASGNEKDIKYWQEQYDEITKAVEESHDEMLASWEETLEAAGSQFDLTIESTIQTLKDSISEFGLDNLADRYSKGQEEQERYLSNLDKEYELNKLNREISGKIDDTDNIKAKQKLLELQDEINQKLASGEEMSRYDLEHLQKKYELELAKIALEEAQNAKSTVRLTKDSEGNFGYVYSADQDVIDDAQQNYEDKLYDMKKASEEYLDEMSEKIIQNQQEMMDALAEVDRTKFKTQEEYEAELDRVKAYYMGRDKYYRGEMQKAMDDLGVTYQQTLLGQLEGSASLEEAQSKLETNTNEATDKMGQAWKDWHDNVDDAMTEAGTSSATFTEDIKADAEEIGTATEDLAGVIDEQTENMVDYMGRLVEAIAGFRDEYLALVDEIAAKNEATVGIGFDENVDYSALMNEYLNNGGKTTDKAFKELLNQRNAKVEYLKSQGYDESYWGTSGEDTLKKYQELEAGGGSAEDREWFTKDYMSDEELAQTFEKLEIPLGALEQTTNDIKTATGEIKTSTDTVGSKVDLTKEALNAANTAISTKTAETGKIINDKLGVTETALKTAIDETDKSLNTILGEIKIAIEAVGTNTETLSDDINNAANTIVSGVGGVIDDIQSSVNDLDKRVNNIERSNPAGFDTGGYTGSWGPEGKMAILHEKEIVLNQNDTSNLLNTMGIMRDIINMIDAQASMASLFNLSASSSVITGNETLEQNVTIHAEFPNATDHNEIEEAFNNLVNRASQYANRK